MACEELKRARKEQLKVLSVFRNKKKSQDTTRYNNDIQKTIKLLEQIDRDIIKCQESQKQEGQSQSPSKAQYKLGTLVTEKSHGTGTR